VDDMKKMVATVVLALVVCVLASTEDAAAGGWCWEPEPKCPPKTELMCIFDTAHGNPPHWGCVVSWQR
jgi:hypothetical protein